MDALDDIKPWCVLLRHHCKFSQFSAFWDLLLAHIKPHLLVNEPMYDSCFPSNFQVLRWLGLRFSASQVPACVLLLPSFAMIVISHLVDANTVVQDDSTLALKRWSLGQVSRWWLYNIISFKLWIQDLVLQASQGPSFKVVVTWKTFPGRQVPAAGLYGALLTLIHHHIIHRPSFGRTIYSVYSIHYLRTMFFRCASISWFQVVTQWLIFFYS